MSTGHVMIGLPTGRCGGTQMQTRALVAALVSGGYRVTVCCYYDYSPQVLKSLEEAGAAVRVLGLTFRRKLGYLAAAGALMRGLKRVIRQDRPDFLHVQYMENGLLPLLAGRLCGVPRMLATVHVTAERYGRWAFVPRRLGPRLADVFLCVSQAAEETYFGDSRLFDEGLLRAGRRHFALPNGIDVREADRVLTQTDALALRGQMGLSAEDKVIGIVGSLWAVKGHRFLLEAMGRIAQHQPRCRLLIVGDGRHRQRLEAQAASLGIAGRIVWAGEQTWRRAMELMTAVDVLAVPSKSESFGLSAAEAMSLGKPVVGSDVPALREVILDGSTGLLTPFGDAGALAEALSSVLADPARAESMGAAGRDRIREHFSMELYTRRLLDIYAALGRR